MQIGDYRVEIIQDTEFRLDGGAMFGVVPRVLWERECPPDERNRIRLNMNCVFIETPEERILIETGIGEKWAQREIDIFGIRRDKPLADSLFEITGYRTDDISVVINTHLHFDHAGGNTILAETDVIGGKRDSAGVIPQFKNARYLVSSREFEHSSAPHERDRASYLSENWLPVAENGQLDLMQDEYEAVPGLSIQTVRGHSETMQTWRLDRGGRTLYGFADLIPTRHHLAPAWIASFDLYPVETLRFKKEVPARAAREEWLCLFYHDFEHPVCSIKESGGKFRAEPIDVK